MKRGTMALSNAELAKLPKWAQAHIVGLEREIAYRDGIIVNHERRAERSRISYAPPGLMARRIYIPRSTSIRFAYDDRNDPSRYVEVRFPSGGGSMNHWETWDAVEIFAAGGALKLMPTSGNVVQALVEKER